MNAALRVTEDCAELVLRSLRWPDGVPVCPACGSRRSYRIATRNSFKCASCGRHFTLTSGTVFDKHKLSLRQVCEAMAFYEATDGSFSAAALSRHIGISYKAAYVLKLRLHEAYMSRRGLLAEPSYLARGYYQGFNEMFLRDGVLYQRTAKGQERRLAKVIPPT